MRQFPATKCRRTTEPRMCFTRLFSVLSLIFCEVWTSIGFGDDSAPSGPKSPRDSAACFRLADESLRIELVASEPDVVSPVALAWDAKGRMFVAEMMDYPLGPMRGRIRLLTDTDRDGRFDHSDVFADDLAFPTSVLPWRDGVLVASAPDILFLRDVNGDGRADERRVILTGFGEGNQQLRVNGLNYGLDNWVYGANGRSDGEIHRPDQPVSESVSIRRRDFRFRPDTGEIQAVVGFSQYGLPRDDWGQRFPSWNTIPIRHVVLDEPTTLRVSRFDAATAVANIVEPTDDGRVFSISPKPQTFNSESTDFYNAMCGLTIFRGDALGESIRGQAFVGESLTNVVHRRFLEPNGPTFIARRIDQQREFLASTDNWFHPVYLTTGPDGALYVADFYRRFVEHPNFAAPHLKEGVNWRDGAQHGRIWRIVRREQLVDHQPPQVAVAKATIIELVASLHHANGWQRDTAQRLLVERQDRESIPLLTQLVRNKQATSLAKIHALWTLSGIQALDDATLLAALDDNPAGVQSQAVRLSESRLSQSQPFRSAVLNLADDADPRLRLEVAQAVIRLADPSGLKLLVKLAGQADADRWLFDVLGWVSDEQAWPLIKATLEQHRNWLDRPSNPQAEFLLTLATRVAGQPEGHGLHELFDLIGSEVEKGISQGCAALILGIDAGLAQRQIDLRQWLDQPPEDLSKSLGSISRAVETIVRDVDQVSKVAAERSRIIQLLKLASSSAAKELAVRLLLSGEVAAVQTASANAIVGWGDAKFIQSMLAGWSRYSPSTRLIVQAACLRSPIALDLLIAAMEAGDVSPAELDQATRLAMARLPDATLRIRAEKLIQSLGGGDRKRVITNYEPALQLAGDVQKGAALFATHCVTCHRIRGIGQSVGPDLSAIAARPKKSLLVDVFDPSRQVSPDFVSYSLISESGRIFVGLVSSETAESVTLKRAEGATDTIARNEISELKASGKSLMPDGMEQKLDHQAVADLFEFLYRPDITVLKQAIESLRQR